MKSFLNKITYIYYDAKLHVIRIRFFGYSHSELYREAWTNALKIAKDNQCNHWFLDQRDCYGILKEDLEWLTERWYPQSVEEMDRLQLDEKRVNTFLLPLNISSRFLTKITSYHRETAPINHWSNYYFTHENQALSFLAQPVS